jgi:hypothetical protein
VAAARCVKGWQLMLTRSRENQMDKAKRTMQDVVRYAQQVAGDERLRADVSAALAHASKAGDQLKREIRAGGNSSGLATDAKLRKNVRAMLDDLDAASNRMRPRRSHRIRNLLLMLVGGVAAALALPRIRPWLTKRTKDFGRGTTEPHSVT